VSVYTEALRDTKTYCWRAFAASFTVFIVESLKAVDAATIFFHPFAEYLKQIGTFEAHLTDASGETRLP